MDHNERFRSSFLTKMDLSTVRELLLEADWSFAKQHVLNDFFQDKFHPAKVKGRFLFFLFAEAFRGITAATSQVSRHLHVFR